MTAPDRPGTPGPSAPAWRPDQLLGAKHDTPDQTGSLVDFEMITPGPDSFDSPDGRTCVPETAGQALPSLPPKWTGKFRTRPVEAEAVQVTAENIREVAAWADEALVYTGDRHGHTDPPWSLHTCMTIFDDEGDSMAEAGDWVVRTGGGFRSYTPDDFAARYEPAQAAVAAAAPAPASPGTAGGQTVTVGPDGLYVWSEPKPAQQAMTGLLIGRLDAFEAGMQAQRDLDAAAAPAGEGTARDLADAVAKSDRLEGQNEDLRSLIAVIISEVSGWSRDPLDTDQLIADWLEQAGLEALT